MATRGRKRGLCLIAATLRVSMLDKSVCAELRNRLIGGTSMDTDVKRLSFDLGMSPRDALAALKPLERGQFLAYGPALDQRDARELVTGEVFTTHPEVGKKGAIAPPAPTRVILALLPKLADLPKEAEQEARSLEDLKRELAMARRELTAAAKNSKPGPSAEDLRAAHDKGFAAGVDTAAKATAAELKSLHSSIHQAVTVIFGQSASNLSERPKPTSFTPPRPQPSLGKTAAPVQRPALSSSGLGKCEQKILAVLSQFPEGCEAGKLTLLAGYRFSGGFRNSLSALRTAGLIKGDNGSVMQITDEGMAHGPFPELPTGDALVQYWLTHPSFGACERKILTALVEEPGGLSAGDLCTATGYEFSGGFRNSLSTLRTAGVLVGKNTETMRLSRKILP